MYQSVQLIDKITQVSTIDVLLFARGDLGQFKHDLVMKID